MDEFPTQPGRYEATILFCDIRGFTSMFDSREPEEALRFANTVLSRLASVVEDSHGTIDKFTGDGFLAYFGLADSARNHAHDACACAVKLRKALTEINLNRYSSDLPVVAVGMGINSGTVAAGFIKAARKSEFTVLGRTVNVASRIESLTKEFGVDCLISATTATLVGRDFMLQTMPERKLRGVNESVQLHWLLPMN